MKKTMDQGHEILSDGRKVWVNGPDGASLARLSAYGNLTMVDVHLPLKEQQDTGSECLDCRHDLRPEEAWLYFVLSLKRNYNITVTDDHKPTWASGVQHESAAEEQCLRTRPGAPGE